VILITAMTMVFITACGSSKHAESSGAASTGGSSGQPNIAIGTSATLKSGYGRALESGIEQIRSKLGNTVTLAQLVQPAAFASTLQDFATRGYKLVMLDGAEWQQAALTAGPKFPGTKFVVVNGFQAAKPNVAAVAFQFEQSGFLAGIAAGLITKSHQVGAVGGVQIPPLVGLFGGFAQGVKYVDPKAHITVAYTGSWTDPSKAAEVTQAQLGKGADVIWGIANIANAGVYSAARSGHAAVIGYGVDESADAPGIMATTATVDYTKVFYNVAHEFDAGKLEPTLTVLGFSQGVFGLAPFGSFVNSSIVHKAAALAAKAEAGQITIARAPSNG
jgi:basic membrane protein A